MVCIFALIKMLKFNLALPLVTDKVFKYTFDCFSIFWHTIPTCSDSVM
jgi:hypothetical protein